MIEPRWTCSDLTCLYCPGVNTVSPWPLVRTCTRWTIACVNMNQSWLWIVAGCRLQHSRCYRYQHQHQTVQGWSWRIKLRLHIGVEHISGLLNLGQSRSNIAIIPRQKCCQITKEWGSSSAYLYSLFVGRRIHTNFFRKCCPCRF